MRYDPLSYDIIHKYDFTREQRITERENSSNTFCNITLHIPYSRIKPCTFFRKTLISLVLDGIPATTIILPDVNL